MNQDSPSIYCQDTLNQIPEDLLSYSLPSQQGGGNPTPDQEFPNTFFEENSSNGSGVKTGSSSAPVIPSTTGLSDFYNQQSTYVSPLDVSFLPQNALSTPMPTPNYNTPLMDPLQDDLEEFLTPLVSPAITPNYTDIFEFLDPPSNEQYFTPLSSPALPPNISTNGNTSLSESPPSPAVISNQNAALLSEQSSQIEARQQILRDQLSQSPTISPVAYRKSPPALFANRKQPPPSPLPFSGSKKRPSLRQQIALASPQLHASQNHHISLPTAPATPASLMKMSHPTQESSNSYNNSTFTSNNIHNTATIVDIMPLLPLTAYPTAAPPTNNQDQSTNKKRKIAPSLTTTTSSPRTLKPLISPFLQPDPAKTLNPSSNLCGIENRRSAHKVAEQRRRDTLKQSFDSLRKEITDVLVMDAATEEEKKKSEDAAAALREEKEKEVKLMSKVLLLQHSYEYILRLKNDSKLKDQKMEKMQSEIDKLKQMAAAAAAATAGNQ